MTNVLLVIDMENEFCKPGGKFYDRNCEAIIPAVKKHTEKRVKQEWEVVVLADRHTESDPECQLLGQHSIIGTRGSSVVDEFAFLEQYPKLLLVAKWTFDGFLGRVARRGQKRLVGTERVPLQEVLKEIEPDKIEVLGVCTDICVFHTVSTLMGLRNAGRLDFSEVVIYKDCVATFDDEQYTAKEKTDFVLNHLKKWFGVKVLDSSEEEISKS